MSVIQHNKENWVVKFIFYEFLKTKHRLAYSRLSVRRSVFITLFTCEIMDTVMRKENKDDPVRKGSMR